MLAKYAVEIVQTGKYEWTGVIVDATESESVAMSITGKSLIEMLGKTLFDVMARDINQRRAEAATPKVSPLIINDKFRSITPSPPTN